MKKNSLISSPEKSKVITINILFITTLMIIFLGIFFSIFSLINNIHFKVLSSSISGAIFGILVLYLGIRYYLSVTKLREELYESSAKFSWRNFKRK
ncbi:hypothetical protein B0P06_004114 [Clostridium saccharoperbutylacetonicum]|uniref:Uncharacterized protein n=1 Tax=Clostridium saccharoperbutylacetonicum N1-4(HMT) TaxID=931276 RepID=M1MMY7_9CLOT|nr:hypothetical protein [Clostridium saccharoperbutylacetonicum]AGF57583.1 hypothetical protein Cspa_c38230 [Clostridium saccharoperbutylacetonicum N1-4(HMT)]NRT61649.1 hypothetical protein [Clostridium saccharoperbutylacetonicum]NSB24972.1 hypothetical protein [Clostridium saccharoperbutylacetonicum]NSB44343.1 hypothetical protein [Clostridium saccharoperbutylacetonicum]